MSAYQRDASKPVKAANYAWEKAGDLKHGNGSEAVTVHFNRQVEIGVRAYGSRRTATENVERDNFQSQRTSRGNCSMAGRPPRYIGWIRISLILLRSSRVVMGPAAGPSPFVTGDDATIA